MAENTGAGASVENSATVNDKEAESSMAQQTDSPDPTASDSAQEPADEKAAKPVKRDAVPMEKFHQKMFSNYMNPMLAELEQKVRQNNEALDRINKKFEDERNERRKERLTQHIPDVIKGEGQKLEDIIENLHNLIQHEYYKKEEGQDPSKLIKAKLKDLDENSEIAVLGHALAAYVSTFEPTHLKHFTTRIVSDLTIWISKLFRFQDASAYFHEEDREGLVRVCRLVLHLKYPKLPTDGFDALYSRPPMIYMSILAHQAFGQYLATQLALPESCIRIVPLSKKRGSTSKMDTDALLKMIEDDKAAGKTPLLMVAFAGTPVLGQNDNLDKIHTICEKNGIWLHLEGSNLSTMMMYGVPTSVRSAKTGDSMTVNLGAWLGLPAVPYTTLYKTGDPEQAARVGLAVYNARFKLSCLPLWISLQNLGYDGIAAKVEAACKMGKQLSDELEKIEHIRNISRRRKPPEEERPARGLKEMFNRAISALIIYELENPTVVFRYVGPPPLVSENGTNEGETSGKSVGEQTDEADDSTEDEESDRDPYFDSLNVWLAETLRRTNPQVHISAVDVDKEGVSIRFSAIEAVHKFNTKPEDITKFLDHIKTHLTILDATVRQRAEFQDIVEAQDNLQLVEVAHWAGLGAIQYIPDGILERKETLTVSDRDDVNDLNRALVHQLKSSDSAFSMGMSVDGMVCVRFGLITEETDLEELVALVFTTGKEVEDSAQFLETMADVVKQGIEAANADLKKENESKLMNEGILRQVPMVGSLMNWWSPPNKDAEAKGRTFNLASGRVESTEATYKYHMQVQEKTPEATPKKSGPLKNNLKPHRKRSSSQSSSTSHQSLSTSSTAGVPNSKPQNQIEAGDAPPATPDGQTENQPKAEATEEVNEVSHEHVETAQVATEEIKQTEEVDLK